MGTNRRLLGVALTLSVAVVAARNLTRLSSRSGVTDAEIARALPGDDLVAGAGHVIDRAATIPAPVATVWPWLVQQGKQRAGWYFPRWVELGIPRGRRGLRTVNPALLALTVGQRVPDWGPGDPQFEVAQIEAEHALVYLSLRQKSRNWTWPQRSDPLPDDVLAFSWALVLTPVDQARSRLHLRLRMRTARERSPAMFFGGLFDWVTVALLFAGLRERVSDVREPMSASPSADRSDPDVALVLRSYEAFARGDIEQAVIPLHPDVEWIEPDEFPNGGRHDGASAAAEYLRRSRSSWAEIVSETTPYRRGGNVVIVHHVNGRMVDGSAHDVTVADVYKLRDGQVVRMQAYADPTEALALDS